MQLLRKLFWLGLLACSVQMSWGYALLGPNNEPWQITDLGYNPRVPQDELLTAPKNIGEEYRRNTPVLYYTFDANFLDFFGTNGAAAVDSAMQILNNLTNVSQYSSDLSEWPMEATGENYLAAALSLYDLKSSTLHLMVEQLGLAEPERYVWTLHDRFVGPGGCPLDMAYLVVQRNWDPITSALNQYQSSSYVNGTLYTYFIRELCTAPPFEETLSEALEVPVDPLAYTFTAVAAHFDSSFLPLTRGLLFFGRFYTGLTRDDVAGLRYLIRTNNVNFESPGPNTLVFSTNTSTPQVLYTSNLTLLAQQALTNDAPTLQALFPGLVISSSSSSFVTVYVTNVTPIFVNYPWDPIGTPAHLAFTTNVVPTIQPRYQHTFANLAVITPVPNGWTVVPLANIPPPNGTGIYTIQNLTVGTAANPWGPVGSINITTNATLTSFPTNVVLGDFVILTNNLCSIDIINSQLTNVISYTNVLVAATNSNIGSTNANGGTNAGTLLSFESDIITYFTNHAFIINPVNCSPSETAAAAGLYQGVEKITFVRRDFDSLFGRTWSPITNTYVLNSITNSSLLPVTVRRTVTAPDFLFTAIDSPLTAGPSELLNLFIYQRSQPKFNSTFAGQGLAGPGTIEGPTTITFNKVGAVFENFSQNAYFIGDAEGSQVPFGMWGSFDATTNAPVVYPNGTSIENVLNQLVIGVLPNNLPDGQVGIVYPAPSPTFTATGGTAPYTWSMAANSPGLPPGLHLLPNGTLYGTPTQDGTFDFTIAVTDAGSRTVSKNYSITINP